MGEVYELPLGYINGTKAAIASTGVDLNADEETVLEWVQKEWDSTPSTDGNYFGADGSIVTAPITGKYLVVLTGEFKGEDFGSDENATIKITDGDEESPKTYVEVPVNGVAGNYFQVVRILKLDAGANLQVLVAVTSSDGGFEGAKLSAAELSVTFVGR